MKRNTSVLSVLLLTGLCLAAGASPAAAVMIETVMTGLANPRGLTFGPDGGLYVAEAGRGGDGPRVDTPVGPRFYGTSGAISRLRGGVQERIFTGLPSLARENGVEATGPHDVAFDSTGTLYAVIGLGANPAVRSGVLTGEPGAELLGQVLRESGDGSLVAFGNDVAGLEASDNPDGGNVDSNPYSLAVGAETPTGDVSFFVTDAGANALAIMTPAGDAFTEVFAPRDNPLGFGPPLYESVPTGVAVGPNGDPLIAELTGFPFPQGEARIWRDTGRFSEAGVFADGFTNLIDIAFDDRGRLYALEIDDNGLATPGGSGALLRIDPDGGHTVVVDGLTNPTGLAIGPDGTPYISNNGLSPTQGEVVRIVSVPEPTTPALLGLGGLVMLWWRSTRRTHACRIGVALKTEAAARDPNLCRYPPESRRGAGADR